MDFFRFIIGFLLFHRRVVLGLLLLIGLYVFLVVILPRFSRSGDDDAGVSERIATSESNTTLFHDPDHTEFLPSYGERRPDVDAQADPQQGLSGNGPMVGSQAFANSALSSDKGTPVPANQILRSNDAAEIIEEIMRLRKAITGSRNDTLTLVLAEDSAKLARRALELQLTPHERRYAMGSLAEALLVSRLGSIANGASIESVDSELVEVTQEFLQHSDPQVRGYAAVIAITDQAFQVSRDPTTESLDGVQKTVDRMFDNLIEVPNYLQRVCRFFTISNLPVSSVPGAQEFLDQLAERMIEHRSNEIQLIGKQFKADLELRRIDSGSLVFQIGDAEYDSENRVDRLFQILDGFPDAGIPVYQIALNVIREYGIQKNIDRARSLGERLENQILPNRTDPTSREQILKPLKDLMSRMHP